MKGVLVAVVEAVVLVRGQMVIVVKAEVVKEIGGVMASPSLLLLLTLPLGTKDE